VKPFLFSPHKDGRKDNQRIKTFCLNNNSKYCTREKGQFIVKINVNKESFLFTLCTRSCLLCSFFLFGFVLNGIFSSWNHRDPLLSHESRKVMSMFRDGENDVEILTRMERDDKAEKREKTRGAWSDDNSKLGGNGGGRK
jgi:hypothetical protein